MELKSLRALGLRPHALLCGRPYLWCLRFCSWGAQKQEAACGKILEDPCHMVPLGSTWCLWGPLRLLTPLNIIKGDTGEV